MHTSKRNHTPKVVTIYGGSCELASALTHVCPDLCVATRYTTRALHTPEIEFYRYIGHSDFQSMDKSGKFLTVSIQGDSLYGTEKKSVEQAIASGKIAVILDCDRSGYLQVQAGLPSVSWKATRSIFIAQDPNDFYAACRRHGDAELYYRLEKATKELTSYDAIFIQTSEDYTTLASDVLKFIYDQEDVPDRPDFRSQFCAELQRRLEATAQPAPDALLRHMTSLTHKKGEDLIQAKTEILAKFHNVCTHSSVCSTYMVTLFTTLSTYVADTIEESICSFYSGQMPLDDFRTLVEALYRTCSKDLQTPPPSGINLELQFNCIEHTIEKLYTGAEISNFLYKQLLPVKISSEALDMLAILMCSLPESWFHQLRSGESLAVHDLAYEYFRVLQGLEQQISASMTLIDNILHKEELLKEDDIQ